MKFRMMLSGRIGSLRRAAAGPVIPWLATFVLLAALGWQGFRMTSMMWPLDEQTHAEQQLSGGADRATVDGREARADERLVRLHLFGIHSPEPESNKQASAPETKLDLALKGVYAPYGDSGMAVIRLGTGEESVFAIGDRVGGMAEVARVLPGRVILRRNGNLEALSMYEEGAGSDD